MTARTRVHSTTVKRSVEDRRLLHRQVPVIGGLAAPARADVAVTQAESASSRPRRSGETPATRRTCRGKRPRTAQHGARRAARRRSPWESACPPAGGERVQRGGSGVCVHGRINRTQRGRERFSVARTGEIEAMPNQVDDARLQSRCWKHGRRRFAHALEAGRGSKVTSRGHAARRLPAARRQSSRCAVHSVWTAASSSSTDNGP